MHPGGVVPPQWTQGGAMCWPGWPYQPHGSGFESREESDTDQDSRERMLPRYLCTATFGLKQSSNLQVASTPRGCSREPSVKTSEGLYCFLLVSTPAD